ncbi:MAG: site-2 protease family protein [Cyanosarcina radialis HA8281-LM2]|jgi:Zn-dependent protease|nr:site-2 protease family protein [Cyanosarcina radialis HA8281-LM2]
MQAGWRIGSLFGIPLRIDYSWLFILAFVTFFYAKDFSVPWGVFWGTSAGLTLALLLFGSVLLHELGHSLAAMSQGIKVNSIALFIFGGVAAIDRESKTPAEAFRVAIAGPVVSLLLFGLFALITKVLPNSGILTLVAIELAKINLTIGLFNLIPGLPLDGGQVLKAAVWQLTGNRFTGVRWAAKTGKLLGGLAVAIAVVAFLTEPSLIASAIWIVLIGSFVASNASNYERTIDLQENLLQVVAADAMTRDFRVVDANLTLRQFADEYILADAWASEGKKLMLPFYAVSDGRYRGLVKPSDLQSIERSRWETETLASIVRPLNEVATVTENTPLAEVIDRLEAGELRHITVLSPAETVAGIIDKGDVVRTLAPRLNWLISPADIGRIKTEGSYPPGLPLGAIAKNLI